LALKREREGKAPFAPHIHRLFNKYGIEGGMRMLVSAASLKPMRILAQTLLYREMFTLAKQQPALLGEIVYLDSQQIGQYETKETPLLIEKIPGGTRSSCWISRKIDYTNGRLEFARGNFKNIGELKSHLTIFDAIKDDSEILGVLSNIDEFFKENCSLSWLDTFEAASAAVLSRLNPKATDPDPLKKFYAELKKEATEVVDEMRTLISTKQSQNTSAGTAAAADDDREY
jgi:hypothetical protein